MRVEGQTGIFSSFTVSTVNVSLSKAVTLATSAHLSMVGPLELRAPSVLLQDSGCQLRLLGAVQLATGLVQGGLCYGSSGALLLTSAVQLRDTAFVGDSTVG